MDDRQRNVTPIREPESLRAARGALTRVEDALDIAQSALVHVRDIAPVEWQEEYASDLLVIQHKVSELGKVFPPAKEQ